MASVLYEYHSPTWDDVTHGLGFFDNQQRGQVIKVGSVGPNVSFELNGLKIPGSKVGAPGNIDVAIYEVDVNGKPTGNAISTGVYNGNQFAVYPAKTAMGGLNSMTACILEADTEYAIVFSDPTGNASNYVIWGGDREDATYPGGWVVMSNDYGETWDVYDGDPLDDNDLSFELYGATVLSGTIANTSNVSGVELISVEELAGTVAVESALTGNVKAIEELIGSLSSASGVTGNVLAIEELVGLIEAQSAVTGNLQSIQDLAGLIEAQSSLTGNIDSILVYSLIGSLAGVSGVTGHILSTEILAGSVTGLSGVAGTIISTETLAGSLAGQSSVAGSLQWLQELAGLIEAQSDVTGELTAIYSDIPPFMEADLIDPFASGAWLWAVQIAIAGQDTVRIVRNTADIHYGGNDFEKFNLEIGTQIFSGDGSIPRVTLRVFQDINRVVEDLINETEGALGAQVKLIRVNEKWLDTPVTALEFDYNSLASESDSEWVTFTLGIPNLLTQRFPQRIYSSSTCPWATPTLFKGPECQYAGEDGTCTGTHEDCYSKGNAEHWGAEIGLDPNCVRV